MLTRKKMGCHGYQSVGGLFGNPATTRWRQKFVFPRSKIKSVNFFYVCVQIWLQQDVTVRL